MLVLIGASGYVHGVLTDRWGMPAKVSAAAARLQRVPAVLGDWQSIDLPMKPRELKVAEAAGALARRYTNRSTGAVVEVLILCGRPGPISVHEPTTCFIGAGFDLHHFDEDVPLSVSGVDAVQCRLGDFVKDSGGARSALRTFWTWSSDGRWQSPSNPRVTFAPSPYLYKMYLSRVASPTEETRPGDDPVVDFMHDFIPALNESLFGKA
jgi:hypothetical protein